jgi:hypothetical protein
LNEKLERLKAVEDMKLLPEAQEGKGGEENFTTRLTAKVIDNIQVCVNRECIIHSVNG